MTVTDFVHATVVCFKPAGVCHIVSHAFERLTAAAGSQPKPVPPRISLRHLVNAIDLVCISTLQRFLALDDDATVDVSVRCQSAWLRRPFNYQLRFDSRMHATNCYVAFKVSLWCPSDPLLFR